MYLKYYKVGEIFMLNIVRGDLKNKPESSNQLTTFFESKKEIRK